MCVCRTFVWGGSGTATVVDIDESCSCECDDGHLDYNILGVASCVPTLAHAICGFGGLIVQMLVLCHAIYSTRRQVSDGCISA